MGRHQMCHKRIAGVSSIVRLCTVVLLIINQDALRANGLQTQDQQAHRTRRHFQAPLSSSNNSLIDDAKFQQQQNGFNLHAHQNNQPIENYASSGDQESAAAARLSSAAPLLGGSEHDAYQFTRQTNSSGHPAGDEQPVLSCPANGLLTFEISTGFIYKPTQQRDTLSMMPSTLQLTDCLDYCLHNQSCLAINFEMGLCVLLAASANKNPQNLYSSQFPVFTIYAEKKCLLANVYPPATKQFNQQGRRFRCQRAWTFERVAGFEMKLKPRRQLQLASRELCMDACLLERDFECRSANWYRKSGLCTLSDQDRHSVSQSEAGDQRIKSSLLDYYGPSNLTSALPKPHHYQHYSFAHHAHQPVAPGPLIGYDKSRLSAQLARARSFDLAKQRLFGGDNELSYTGGQFASQAPVSEAPVDYLENNCVYEPNKLCEFRKIQNRVLKTVDSIYQDVASLDECKQKCLTAPYRCYSFDYGDTSERVCRTSHLDQASLLSVREPYLDVVGAITYELASCFNVTIQCRAKEMVASVSASKSFKGKIYAKSRPTSCLNDVHDALQFNLSMRYNDDACDVHASSGRDQGVFSQDIVIQHHDRIVTTQDVGLSVYCQYDLGNRSVTNQVDLAIERIPDQFESKQHQSGTAGAAAASSLTITGLATTVVKSPNVTMRITNMNGQPVSNATVGDRLALLFEIKEKTSPFGIFVRNIVAMDGKQLMLQQQPDAPMIGNQSTANGVYHYAGQQQLSEGAIDSLLQQNAASSIQFIDSDGCPTDANLMGPLVKMDPSGHRLLAPFDAFKFPTSDMVFFRAVVTSCLAECGPAVCGSVPQSAMLNENNIGDGPVYSTQTNSGADLTTAAGGTAATTTTTTTISATLQNNRPTAADHSSFLTTRTMAATTTSPNYITTTVATADIRRQQNVQSASGDDQRVGGSLDTTDYPKMTTLSSTGADSSHLRPTTSHLAEDSMTIVPGFASSKSLDQLNEIQSTVSPLMSGETTKMMLAAATEAHQLMINMTNNHNGRAPPRPTTVGVDYQSAATQPVPQQLPNDLISLSKEQKQELVKLFETKLKQPSEFAQPSVSNANLSDLRDLYTGFLSSLMLNEFGQQQSAGSPPSTSKSNDLISSLANNINYKKQLEQQNAIEQRPHSSASANLLIDVDNAPLDLPELIRAQASDKNDAQIRQDVANYLSEVQNKIVDKQENNGLVTGSQQQSTPVSDLKQQQAQSINRFDVSSKIAQPEAIAQQRQKMQKKRDMANRQALFDSYMGAFQPHGRRRRRRRRRDAIEDNSSDAIPSPAAQQLLSRDHIYMEQPQVGKLTTVAHLAGAPSLSGDSSQTASCDNHLVFKRAIVEMYHTHSFDRQQHARIKRQATSAAHQEDDLEELVVQSIKIVDRLHFEDEQQNQQQATRKMPPDVSSRVHPKPVTGAMRHDEARSLVDSELANSDEQSGFTDQTALARGGFGLSALSVFLVSLCFIFVQLSMVLIYLVGWTRRRSGGMRKERGGSPMQFATQPFN